ncbi:unnamed protein product [Sphenostylis stenocarpa]|uniref:Uncharacterized protein n=1 Tax=Sphenostylis stenocarpa TaxID=92480 RepID=A0AA86V3G6_9FABA|nr:unnamed protein product [Sphenostylis stenocarpa]
MTRVSLDEAKISTRETMLFAVERVKPNVFSGEAKMDTEDCMLETDRVVIYEITPENLVKRFGTMFGKRERENVDYLFMGKWLFLGRTGKVGNGDSEKRICVPEREVSRLSDKGDC